MQKVAVMGFVIGGMLKSTSSPFRSAQMEAFCNFCAMLIRYLQDGHYTVKGSIKTKACVEDVWSVLVDYPGLADVFSNIKKSKIASSKPDIVLHQVCLVLADLSAIMAWPHQAVYQRMLQISSYSAIERLAELCRPVCTL